MKNAFFKVKIYYKLITCFIMRKCISNLNGKRILEYLHGISICTKYLLLAKITDQLLLYNHSDHTCTLHIF